MNTTDQATPPEWSPSFYDQDYYGRGARGGFRSYDYHSQEQQEQLALKWQFCAHVEHRRALFIGCALGFEVAHWFQHGKMAGGYDVSQWAIAHQVPSALGQCVLYDGKTLPQDDNAWPLVAAFDVLHHLPDEILFPLVKEICRVASKGIVFRVVVKNWRNMDRPVDGIDGAILRYRRLEEWDRLFTESGKFQLDWLKMHHQYEVTAIYQRT